jgi:diadenylate cyclase
MPEILQQLKWQDTVDILVVSFIIYRLFIAIRGTRAVQMIVGLFILIIVSFISEWGQLRAINWILQNFWTIWVLAVVVLFQPELRRTLAEVGKHRFFAAFHKIEKATLIEEIVRGAIILASRKNGALIVFENETELQNYVEAGTTIDAQISRELLCSIFNPKSPLHDGAVIIRNGRIAAAGCFLPLTMDQKVSKELGTRHRAALGITEETDAVVIIISEETGSISIAMAGGITRDLDTISLRRNLQQIFEPPQKEPKKAKLVTSKEQV